MLLLVTTNTLVLYFSRFSGISTWVIVFFDTFLLLHPITQISELSIPFHFQTRLPSVLMHLRVTARRLANITRQISTCQRTSRTADVARWNDVRDITRLEWGEKTCKCLVSSESQAAVWIYSICYNTWDALSTQHVKIWCPDDLWQFVKESNSNALWLSVHSLILARDLCCVSYPSLIFSSHSIK